ncbi:hypothetical protein GCM10025788_27310 [Serinicoccus chungangensis]
MQSLQTGVHRVLVHPFLLRVRCRHPRQKHLPGRQGTAGVPQVLAHVAGVTGGLLRAAPQVLARFLETNG